MSDWETVTVLRKRPPKPSTMKTEKVMQVLPIQNHLHDATLDESHEIRHDYD